jgi:hypothetical protein
MIKLLDILNEIQQERQLKEGWIDIALGTAMTAASLFGGDDVKAQSPTQSKPGIEKTITTPETVLRNFIFAPGGGKNIHSWESINGEYINYGFFKNGNLFRQGSDGEASMGEGKWVIKGNKLIITDDYKGTTKTFTPKIIKGKTVKEDRLILGDQVFKRIFPLYEKKK